MKTQTLARATRRILLAAAVAATATLAANAATTTYYQAKNWECAYELASGADGVEIGYTPQIAFPSLTIDDIPEGATFFTTIFGDNVSTDYRTSVGMHEVRRDTDGDGHADKMALQFTVYDGNSSAKYTKGVILVLTNGEGGVYVQKYCQFYKNTKNNWSPHVAYFTMNASGSITEQNSPAGWSISDATYRASGFRTHGMSPVNTAARLAFPGTTLKQLKGGTFMAGYRFGKNMDGDLAEADDQATYVTNWPSDDDIQKIVMQFRARGNNNRTAIIELTESAGNVYAKHVLSCYNGAANTKYFSIDDSGNVTLSSGTSATRDAYPVHDLYVQYAPCVKKTPNSIKVFSDPSKTLTLDDIADGDFTARMCGGWIAQSFRETPNSALGYNKKLYEDETSGNVTNIVVEFQVRDGSNTKCLVVSFENGEDGIYAKAINARYTTNSIGHQFRDYNGTLHGSANNNSGETFAETLTANGYGAFDMRVTMRTIYDWTLDADKDWTTLSGGVTPALDEVVRITVTGGSKNHTLTVDEDVDIGQIRFVDGSAAIFKVAAGNTLEADFITGLGYLWVADGAMFNVDGTVDATSLKNDGTVVKRVAADAFIPVNNDSTGTTIVSNGALKVSKMIGSGTAHKIRVVSGATYDLNGVADVTANVTLEGGATIANTGGVIGDGTKQTVKITLEGDATAKFSNDFGLLAPNHGVTRLELGSNTFTLDGSRKNFWLDKTTITGTGTIYVDHGWLHPTHDASTGSDCTVNITSGGGLILDSNLTVSNFVNGALSGNIKGSSTLTVKGQLTPGSTAIPKLTLEDGATVKATGTAQVVSTTFAASGTITVDASDIDKAQLVAASGERIPVLTVPAGYDHSNVKWTVAGTDGYGAKAKWVDDDGGATKTLYVALPKGLTVILK